MAVLLPPSHVKRIVRGVERTRPGVWHIVSRNPARAACGLLLLDGPLGVFEAGEVGQVRAGEICRVCWPFETRDGQDKRV